MFPEWKEFINRFSFRDEKGNELSNTVEIVFIELSKLSDIMKKPINDMTGAEQWSIFFAYGGDRKYVDLINNLCEARSGIKMAEEILSTISRDERERALFRSRRKFEMDMAHNYAVAIDKGREEAAARIARNLLEINLSLEEIEKVTGLTLQEIEELREKH